MCSSFHKSALLSLLMFAISGCNVPPPEGAVAFYNLDSLIDQQVEHLSRLQPVLEKEAEVNGEQEEARLVKPDSSAWAKELDIFRQLDLNAKTLNAARYETKSGIRDVASNLSIIEYTATEELPLSQVRIYYLGTPDNVRKIEGKFRSKESNRLYSSERHLTMELMDINSKAMLTQYRVVGGQKMILGDTVRYNVAGALRYE